ncbi:MAG: glycosyltransferase [Humidesulfovibrio sp.]|uniref:glycosyltransferase n=1 Tax=Humidesulfovibrio sp. TaxID=2910988 RepID=UPI0027338FE5|nr:glycosyltransferase [Humidesulfovibrio sp.]MDP2849195.1 glycosyltransferase [Humidesulfovibrio sp.]
MPADLNASLANAWLALPESLRQRLALASTGWRHLALAGAECLRLARTADDPAEKSRLQVLAADILLWAFGENPLSGPLAAEILSAADLPLCNAARTSLSAVATHWRAPEGKEGGLAYFERLAQRRDTRKLADFLAGQVQKDPAGLFWREKALALALYSGAGELAEFLEATALEGLSGTPGFVPASRMLRAQAAFLRGDLNACLHELTIELPLLQDVYGPAFAAARAGLALLSAGEDTAALPLLRDCLAAAPWQAGLAQVAADAQNGLRHRLTPPPGPALIMLYSWNKSADLDATLASLFASDLSTKGGGRARVMVLDNGSSDETAQVLDAWQGRAGESLLRMDLPVNIGAPAARNWLAATPEAKAAEILVYLDDDVDLPPDWLHRLGAALEAHPDTGVVGCRVADHQAPHLLQNVAGHLVVPPDAPEDRPDLDFQSLAPNPFRLADAHLQGPDWGLFDFVGACGSVTGCCHLFRRAAFDAVGPFSLALGPSQYDDFERDLRMLAAGRVAVCQGHLRVRHRKRSGLAAQEGDASSNAFGNRYKMQTMHTREEIAGFIAAQALRLGEAVAGAFALLDRAGDPS